jgi:hypothetical protein
LILEHQILMHKENLNFMIEYRNDINEESFNFIFEYPIEMEMEILFIHHHVAFQKQRIIIMIIQNISLTLDIFRHSVSYSKFPKKSML